jgi:hypothetical protein
MHALRTKELFLRGVVRLRYAQRKKQAKRFDELARVSNRRVFPGLLRIASVLLEVDMHACAAGPPDHAVKPGQNLFTLPMTWTDEGFARVGARRIVTDQKMCKSCVSSAVRRYLFPAQMLETRDVGTTSGLARSLHCRVSETLRLVAPVSRNPIQKEGLNTHGRRQENQL